MADPRDDLDAWMNAQVQPLPPPPGTFELIRKRARRRKVTRAAAAAAGAAAVIAVIATVPRLVITQLNVGPGPAASGNAAGNTSSAGENRQHTASASPSAVPSRSASASAPALPPAPGNFQATSVTFVGLNTGFVLGQAGTPGQCGPPSRYICTSIAGTGDHGSTWHGVRAPVSGAPAGGAGVSQVRFYNTTDGWAFGPQLWATHDGGQTWTRIRTHGLRVTALEAAGQRVFAVWAQCSGGGPDFAADCTSSALYSASPGGDQWAPVPGAGTGYSLSGTAGSAALVLGPSRGYLLAPDGTLLSGPVTSAGAWQPATSTATGTSSAHQHGQRLTQPGHRLTQPGTLRAGSRAGRRPAVRRTAHRHHQFRAGPGVHQPGHRRHPGQAGLHLRRQRPAVAEDGDRAGCGHRDLGGGHRRGDDRARHHGRPAGVHATAARPGPRPRARCPSGGFSYVGMTSPQQGVAVPADTAQHAVWFTFDGGRTWHASPIS